MTQNTKKGFLLDNINSDICIRSQMSFARKDKVRILRQESYWFNQIGEIVSIDKSPAMRYPVTVKFEKCDFKAFSGVDGGANTSQFSAKELEAAAS